MHLINAGRWNGEKCFIVQSGNFIYCRIAFFCRGGGGGGGGGGQGRTHSDITIFDFMIFEIT